MLHATLNCPETWSPFLRSSPVWGLCLDWLRTLTPETPLGTYELDGPTLHASVQEYTTQERPVCRFESHREHIDIQYTIAGIETIDWIPRDALSPDGPFGNDVQFWHPADGYTPITQSVGRFSIFFPNDAHRPKVIHGQPTLIRKVVIKIPVTRFPASR